MNTATPEELVRQTTDLVSLPDIYIRLKAVMDDPDSSMVDVGNVVSQDPALIARLLKIANSPFFGFPSRIETITRAVSLLGTQQIHDLVLATTVADAFSGIASDVVSMEDFWAKSIRCGLLSRLVAVKCNVLDSERLFVEGMLHDIGHLLMYQAVPEASQQALNRWRAEARPLYRIEREVVGCDYAQVGAALMRNWNFPPGLVESVQCQNEPASAEQFPLEASIMNIAVRLAEMDGCGKTNEEIVALIDPRAWQVTGLATDVIEPVCAAAAEQLDTTINMLFQNQRRSA